MKRVERSVSVSGLSKYFRARMIDKEEKGIQWDGEWWRHLEEEEGEGQIKACSTV